MRVNLKRQLSALVLLVVFIGGVVALAAATHGLALDLLLAASALAYGWATAKVSRRTRA